MIVGRNRDLLRVAGEFVSVCPDSLLRFAGHFHHRGPDAAIFAVDDPRSLERPESGTGEGAKGTFPRAGSMLLPPGRKRETRSCSEEFKNIIPNGCVFHLAAKPLVLADWRGRSGDPWPRPPDPRGLLEEADAFRWLVWVD